MNSIEVSINKKCYVVKVKFTYFDNEVEKIEKITQIDEIESNGVNCKQWFNMDSFNKRFKK